MANFTESWHLPVFFSLFQILFHLHAMLMFTTAKCTAASILVFARHIFCGRNNPPKHFLAVGPSAPTTTFTGGAPWGQIIFEKGQGLDSQTQLQ